MAESTINYPRYGGDIVSLSDKKFGFIRSGEVEKDIFFHANELTNVMFDDLRPGDSIGFDVVDGPKGLIATNVGKNGYAPPLFRRDLIADVDDSTTDTDEVDVPKYGTVAFAVDNFSISLAKTISDDPDQIDSIEWRDLERLVAITFSDLGFDVELTPGSNDGGKDIVITQKSDCGSRSYFVEIKHWKTKAGLGPVMEFLHVVVRNKQSGGLFLSTNGFTSNVVESLTQLDRRIVRLGTKQKIITMCKNYVRMRNGVWKSPQDIEDVLFDDTI